MFRSIEGTFYRAIDPVYAELALNGSHKAGRYSREDQPTLYLSSSPEGVAAAMIAHQSDQGPERVMLKFHVKAPRIFDLRDPTSLQKAGVNLTDATAPWQDKVAEGEVPTSWKLRDHLEELGANGIIDPSRKAPRLWHLVIFRWNDKDGAEVSKAQREF